MEAGDLPQGASPFNQDVDYELGAVFTRAGLTAYFAGKISGAVNYAKTFTLPTGQNQLLILDQAGGFYYSTDWVTLHQIGTVISSPVGPYANSVTQFGREYLAFSDGVNGYDIPRQWDGTYFDRVSQDGPGASPLVTDIPISGPISGAGGLIPLTAPIISLSESGELVTVNLAGANAFSHSRIGDLVTIAGNVDGYDGTFPIVSILGTNTAILANPTTGLSPSSGGTLNTGVVAVSPAPGNLLIDQLVAIAGATDPSFDGTFAARNPSPIGTQFYVYNLANSGTPSGGGTVSIVGSITAGVHQLSVAFLTRQGYITKFSPPVSWTSAGGGVLASITGLPIGPSNIVARILAFTAAGGDFFFYIPQPTVGSVTGTQINDNSSTTAIVDFSDQTLLAATSIDQLGNNLFGNVTLGPCSIVKSYADRMFWGGEYNKIQILLNMAFDGGFDPTNTFPLGWTQVTSGGAKSSTALWGFAYRMTFSGPGPNYGMIQQSAYQDYLGTAILQPNTTYVARVAGLQSGTGGNVVLEFYSPSLGSLSKATFNITLFPIVSAFSVYAYQTRTFSLATPATIPADTVLRVYATGGGAGQSVSVDELMIYPQNQPLLSTSVRGSYVINPETFDGVTGTLGVDQLNGKPIRCLDILRDNLYITKDGAFYSTTDNGTTEPNQWQISTISDVVGSPSIFGTCVGEEFIAMVSQKGLYLYNGQEPVKISQEEQSRFDAINWNSRGPVWMINDIKGRRIMIGVPVNGSSFPNQIYMVNYRELNTSWTLAEQGPVHVSYSGKMISWDMSRKWSPWNIAANCGAIVKDNNLNDVIVLGTNLDVNKLCLLDQNATSDDGAAILWAYNTFFFVNRDMEQAMQMGIHRKLYTYMTMFVSGPGTLSASIIADSLTSLRSKALANRTLKANPGNETEWPINFTGERCSIQLSNGGGAGSIFRLSKLTVSMRRDPYMPIRGIGNA